jgi:hypothetical protein
VQESGRIAARMSPAFPHCNDRKRSKADMPVFKPTEGEMTEGEMWSD